MQLWLTVIGGVGDVLAFVAGVIHLAAVVTDRRRRPQ
jgi:hypothetical protein